MNCLKTLLCSLLILSMVNTLHADPITYADAGTLATEVPGQNDAANQVIFYIDSPEILFSSLEKDSAYGVNLVSPIEFQGKTINSVQIPADLLLGMRDERPGSTDLKRKDEKTVEMKVSSAVTPEPSSLLLLGTGMIGLILFLVRRKALRGIL